MDRLVEQVKEENAKTSVAKKGLEILTQLDIEIIKMALECAGDLRAKQGYHSIAKMYYRTNNKIIL